MSKEYVKKPQVIETIKWEGVITDEVKKFLTKPFSIGENGRLAIGRRLEELLFAYVGDYILKLNFSRFVVLPSADLIPTAYRMMHDTPKDMTAQEALDKLYRNIIMMEHTKTLESAIIIEEDCNRQIKVLQSLVDKATPIEALEKMLGISILELFKEDLLVTYAKNEKGETIGRSITYLKSPITEKTDWSEMYVQKKENL